MKKLERQVAAVIAEYHMILPGERVLAGVSGGADSVCLFSVLLALREALGCSIAVVHVNHGMRAEAADEETFVRRLAGERGVPFYTERADVPALQRAWRCSPEDAARRARYEAFARVLKETGADKLAVAHNRGDQAETVLLKLFRGAGLRGFAGMAPIRAADGGEGPFSLPVIRPLLFTERGAIEDYLTKKGLAHVEDASNESDRYARNRIRGTLLPWAEREINAGAEAHLADAAARAREALSFVEAEALARCLRLRLDGGGGAAQGAAPEAVVLNAALLRREPVFMQKEILFAALREAGAAREIGEAQIGALLRLAASDSGSRAVDLPNGFRAVREYGALSIARRDGCGENAEKSSAERSEIPLTLPADGGTLSVSLPGAGEAWISVFGRTAGAPAGEIPADTFTKWFDCDKIEKPVAFRKRRQGDWIDTGAGRRSLKKEMIDRKIPAVSRDCLWLLAAGDEILWIVGSRRCEAYKVTAETRRVLQVEVVRDAAGREAHG